jgi:hypothetical protein
MALLVLTMAVWGGMSAARLTFVDGQPEPVAALAATQSIRNPQLMASYGQLPLHFEPHHQSQANA